MTIKRSYTTTALFLFFLFSGMPDTRAQTRATTPEFSETLRFQAQVDQDTTLIRALVSEDLEYIHSNGLIETDDDFVASVASGKIVYGAMTPVSQPTVKRYGKTAVLTGVIGVAGSYKGTAFDIQLQYTSVYRKRRGKWLLVNWQSLKL